MRGRLPRTRSRSTPSSSSLAEPAAAPGLLFGRAQVIAVEYGDAARTVAEASRAERRDRFPGYRVCIFSDNGPEAREGAFAARKLFEETFPGVKVCMGYDIPYFKVSVGNCLTTEEAIILKERVSATFPGSAARAVLLRRINKDNCP